MSRAGPAVPPVLGVAHGRPPLPRGLAGKPSAARADRLYPAHSRAENPPEKNLDPAGLPERIRDKLAVIGFWNCPPDLRDRVTHWDELDERDAAVADSDLQLLGSALAR